MAPSSAEHRRLADSLARKADWKNWGPYVSDRAWGTVREDYSDDAEAWWSFPHEHARSRAYRWNEDGLGGFCNRFQNVCLALALWNGRDPFLKERLFGTAGPEGNHGEDCKEYYFHLDGVPTHSYMKMLYKYPQVEYPYTRLVEESRRRDRRASEFELVDALGEPLRQGRYFDVFIEYAKADEEVLLQRITAVNRGREPAVLHVLPHLWYRNTWSWRPGSFRPELRRIGKTVIETGQKHMGMRWWYLDDSPAFRDAMFTENETNFRKLFGSTNPSPYRKDGFHEMVVSGRRESVNPDGAGSKAAGWYLATVPPGGSFVVRSVFADQPLAAPFAGFETVFERRISEADEFHAAIQPPGLPEDDRRIQRQALAGLLWTKQFYHYSVPLWLDGDPAGPKPPEVRKAGRNASWRHLTNLDVLSVPDKWEYPWYAAWDLAFHCLPIARVDPEWAKRQLVLVLREWYMHPNGQIPAYEWNFSDVNPPVHAWACLRVYLIDKEQTGRADTAFLEEVFHKLLLNFTWWVNRKDTAGKNVFQGGFLGLDNIGVFDRSKPLPGGGYLEQADGTAWMGMFCLNMLAIALELARTRPAYEAVATKFFEHFIYIADAINASCGETGLWDEAEGFYYDKLHTPDGRTQPLTLRSFVGLVPLFAVETFDAETVAPLAQFRRRVAWFVKYRPNLVANVASLTHPGEQGRFLLSLVGRAQLTRVLRRMLDPEQFLSPFGLRSMSREHLRSPYVFNHGGESLTVTYEPAESASPLFGGNSNWRGPIWYPVNYLMIEALRRFHHFYGESLKVPLPSGSDRLANLDEVAQDLAQRLIAIFRRDPRDGSRPVLGDVELFQHDEHWKDHIPFYEYFHGDTGHGLGASHQTGWTALVAELIQASMPSAR